MFQFLIGTVRPDKDATQYSIIQAKNFEEFQKKYKQASERVRSNVQKISEKRKTTEGVFSTYNNGKSSTIRPHSVIKNLGTSEIGKEVMEYINKNNVPVRLCYGIDNRSF